jgi:hypothetical protein
MVVPPDWERDTAKTRFLKRGPFTVIVLLLSFVVKQSVLTAQYHHILYVMMLLIGCRKLARRDCLCRAEAIDARSSRSRGSTADMSSPEYRDPGVVVVGARASN